MIFSIGYERLTPARLAEIARLLNVTIIDCRSSVRRCKAGFYRGQLEALLGARYEYRGGQLGGRGDGVTALGLTQLVLDDHRGLRLMLMCQEAAPGDCHRQRTISVPLLDRGVDVLHVFHDQETGIDQVFHASSLKAAMDEGPDGEYDFLELGEYVRLNGASI